MTKFISELGAGYMNDMLGGAPFMHDGEVYLFSELTGRTAIAYHLNGPVENIQAEAKEVPASIFTGWSTFSFPVLGYRSALNGQILIYQSRVNSTRRGLNPRDIQNQWHDVSHACASRWDLNLPYFNTANVKAYMVMKPVYTGFAEGLHKILKGEIASFALSAEFAVAPSDNVPFLEILFRQRRVGTIDADGNVNIEGANLNVAWNNVVNGELTNG